jgi:hypothetical protein
MTCKSIANHVQNTSEKPTCHNKTIKHLAPTCRSQNIKKKLQQKNKLQLQLLVIVHSFQF